MNELTPPPGAAELPADYRARLSSLDLLPAWTLLRAVMPIGAPVHQAQAKHWAYRDIRPELLQAGELVTAERAERRVLAFVNPGIDPARMATMPSIFFRPAAHPTGRAGAKSSSYPGGGTDHRRR